MNHSLVHEPMFNRLLQPRPINAWPIWARIWSRRRLPEDRGLGDTIEHEVGLCGSAEFIFWHHCIFGAVKRPKCPRILNQNYPYEKAPR